MTTSAVPIYAGYRFPAEVISHAVWLYFRFPLSLRMVDELLAARGIIVSYETVRQWARKFGQVFANQIRRRLPAAGNKWRLDEAALKIAGKKHWLWRAVDHVQGGPNPGRGAERNQAAAAVTGLVRRTLSCLPIQLHGSFLAFGSSVLEARLWGVGVAWIWTALYTPAMAR